MSVNVPSDVKHPTQPLTSTFAARSYALRTICSLLMGKSLLLDLSKRLAPGRVHLRCHKSTVVFQKPGWHRFSGNKRWRSKIFPRIRWPFPTPGASIVLHGMSPIVEISDSAELCLDL